MRPVLLIDGSCNLCSRSVQLVADHERDPELRFASLQSDAARALLGPHGIDPDSIGSMVLIDDEGVHLRSDAALRLAARMRAPWSWARALRLVPRGLRDAVYGVIARNRHRWFGRRDACDLPRRDLADRFLETTPSRADDGGG